MNKFNKKTLEFSKVRKEKLKDRKKKALVAHQTNAVAVSGKRTGKSQRKEARRWRKAQSEAIQTGLVTMEDIEMLTAENGGEPSSSTAAETPNKNVVIKKKGVGFKLGKKTKVKTNRRKRLSGNPAPASVSGSQLGETMEE